MRKPSLTRRESRRILIAGAGAAGRSLAEDADASGDVVVGFLDDEVASPDVLGKLADVEMTCRAWNIDVVYLAIPSADASVVRDFVSRVPTPDVSLAIIPRTYRIVARDKVAVSDLTDVDVLDLVGRAPVKHDMLKARNHIRGRRVLVTGAAGSIGSRIVTQLLELEPSSVVCVDRSESGMFRLAGAVQDYPNAKLEIGDIQSETRIAEIMRHHRPELVFHVAAYKHVPLMQTAPIEAFNNNVGGSLNVFQQAAIHEVEHVVYVSTDKAVHPTNVMGATKRLGELMLKEISQATKTRFTSVRFGNVLESEGSVMQIFRRQLEAGQDLTVTHPDITRYFMTIDEASQLVLQTVTTDVSGQIFVLDMGEPISVRSLAENLISVVNPTLKVVYSGLRPGEKMFEELSYANSLIDATTHPKIFIVAEESIESAQTLKWVEETLKRTRRHEIEAEGLVAQMRRLGFAALQ